MKKGEDQKVNFLKCDPKPALSKSGYTTECSPPPRNFHNGLHEILAFTNIPLQGVMNVEWSFQLLNQVPEGTKRNMKCLFCDDLACKYSLCSQ
jgi:hypothetical protein